jgi:hypothetical protein
MLGDEEGEMPLPAHAENMTTMHAHTIRTVWLLGLTIRPPTHECIHVR